MIEPEAAPVRAIGRDLLASGLSPNLARLVGPLDPETERQLDILEQLDVAAMRPN